MSKAIQSSKKLGRIAIENNHSPFLCYNLLLFSLFLAKSGQKKGFLAKRGSCDTKSEFNELNSYP
jgi:hypothetical protein